MKKHVNKTLVITLVTVISLITACAGIDRPVTEVISTPITSEQKVDPETIARQDFLAENNYSFTLTPEKTDRPGQYTRKEIESFLCSCVESYIRAEEVYRFAPAQSYFVRAKKHVENEKQSALNHEINKWFEDEVTVTARGNVTILDKKVIVRFYRKINQIIGKEKFLFKPGLKVANIVVEFASPDNSLKVHEYLGETSVLQDNLRVSMGIKNSGINLDIYRSGTGNLITNSRVIKFSPEELEFRKRNRLVKTLLQNILDPRVRHFALVHELLHTVGLVGHSPYHESQLFPLPVRAYDDPLPSLTKNSELITPMAERMVEMLYRPDILPGMIVRETANILIDAKHLHLTGKNRIKEFLTGKKQELLVRKQKIMALGKENYDSRMRLYLEMGRFEIKEHQLLEEWREIKKAYKEPAQTIDVYKKQKNLMAKLAHLRRELILLENGKKKYGAQNNSRRQYKRCNEEIAVVNDLIKLQNQAAASEQKLNAIRGTGDRKEMEIQLRRVIRQLRTIDKELNPAS